MKIRCFTILRIHIVSILFYRLRLERSVFLENFEKSFLVIFSFLFKNLSRKHLVVWKFLIEVPKFKENLLIWVIAVSHIYKLGTPDILSNKIKPVALIISSHEIFKLEYLRITFCCFFIVLWPPIPKVILVLLCGWRQIVQQDLNSHSVSHFNF